MFALDPTLAADSAFVAKLSLCQIRLMNQKAVPWLLLIPEREGMTEMHKLQPADQQTLLHETMQAAALLERLFQPRKINIATLGNIVSQLHVHVIARFETDPAWPKPVWGALPPAPYEAEMLAGRISALEKGFAA